MRIGDKQLFRNNPALLQEMLKLKKEGWSDSRLGRFFKVDRTSIIYQCQKHGVSERGRKFFRKWIQPKRIQPMYRGVLHKKIYKSELELTPTITERINIGHPYLWHLEREEQKTKSKARILIESLKQDNRNARLV